MRKVYFFDFDGTICDSFTASLAVMRDLSPIFRVRPVDDSEIPMLRRLSMGGLMTSLEIQRWKVPLMVWCARRKMTGHMPSLVAFAGMKEVLAALRDQHLTTAIVTSNSRRNVRQFLDRHGIAVDIVCAGSSLSGKARLLRKLIARLGVSPAEVLYIGDETRDVVAAKAAGIPCAAVTWGFNTEDALRLFEPHYVIRRPFDLLDIP